MTDDIIDIPLPDALHPTPGPHAVRGTVAPARQLLIPMPPPPWAALVWRHEPDEPAAEYATAFGSLTLWVSPGEYGWEAQVDSGLFANAVWRGTGYPSRGDAVAAVWHFASGFHRGMPGLPGDRGQNRGTTQ